ncbi:MAG: hypothetical protein A2612_03680 [Candidatus Moranbacteria bacterium RIFOXYD1_FULL_44_12]|nr:MAG: hypothetical protein A2612_03680 [Candidatus Moranbacteria bacterium RIFOXYD1_FULL_44_12]
MRLKIGLSLLFIFFVWRFSQLIKLSFYKADFQSQITVGIDIERIAISKVGLDLPVQTVAIKNGVWEVPQFAVGHLNQSAKINGGNIVLYAHNTKHLFGPIRWLVVGDEIILTGIDGRGYKYQVSEMITVKPNVVDYVLPTDSERLTLFTCTGIFDSQRFIVVATPVL